MKTTPAGVLRGTVLVLGGVSGPLLVRVLDEGFARADRPLGAAHLAFGLALAAAVMPGPLLCAFVDAGSAARLRGLAFGGCVVTAFVALLGGAFLWRAATASAPGGAATAAWTGLAWCAMALPVAAADGIRVRWGRPDREDAAGDGADGAGAGAGGAAP